MPLTSADWNKVEDFTLGDDVLQLVDLIKAHGGPEYCLNLTYQNQTMLSLASLHDAPNVISSLLEMKADPNFKPPEAKNTELYVSPFQTAVMKIKRDKVADDISKKIIRSFIKHGANPLDMWSKLDKRTHLSIEACNILENAIIYTPDCICAALLEACIGKSFDPSLAKTPEELAKVKFIDPSLAKTPEELASVKLKNFVCLDTAIVYSRPKTCELLVSKFCALPCQLNTVAGDSTPIVMATTNEVDATLTDGRTIIVHRIISGPICALLINAGANPFDKFENSEKTPCSVIKRLHLTKYPGITGAYNAIRNHARARTLLRRIRGLKLPVEVIYRIGWFLLPKESTIRMEDYMSYIDDQDWKF